MLLVMQKRQQPVREEGKKEGGRQGEPEKTSGGMNLQPDLSYLQPSSCRWPLRLFTAVPRRYTEGECRAPGYWLQ